MLALASVALRSLFGAVLEPTLGGASEAVCNWIEARFSDPSQKLPAALRRAIDRAWRSLEIALAGESLWSRLTDSAEDKAFRDELRQYLQANALSGYSDDFRKRCLRDLQAARRANHVPGTLTDGAALAKDSAGLARFAPNESLQAEWRTIARMGSEFRTAGYINLAELLETRPVDQSPLLALAVRFFFRREIEADPALFAQFTTAQISGISDSLQRGFEGLSIVLEKHAHRLEEVLTLLAELRADILDFRAEQRRQGADLQAVYNEVRAVSTRIGNLAERSLRSSDSLSLHNESERAMVRQLVGKYRRLSEKDRRELPALLDAIGKLEMAAGDWGEAQSDFQTVSTMVADPAAQATAHAQAFLAALEQSQWDDALVELGKAVSVGGSRFSPYPTDRYEVERILGAGGFGIVYLCRQRFSGARLVIKALRADGLDRDVASIFREATALESLEHPNIIRLRDCGFADNDPGRPYLVMDYFEGKTLEKYVQDHGPLAVADCRAVAIQIAEGMLAAHRCGILHRDIKPANILLRSDVNKIAWRVKLIDFGLAVRPRVMRESMASTDVLARTLLGSSISGTLKFSAPEQLGELPNVPVSPRSDLYAFAKTCC